MMTQRQESTLILNGVYPWGIEQEVMNPKVWTGFNDLATWYPEIAAEFHPAKNRKKTAADVYKCTPKKFWWKCSRCGQEWYSSVKDRVYQGALCAKCRKRLIHSN